MDQSKIDMFLATNAKKFNPMQMEQVKRALSQADDSKFQIALSLDYKDPTTMLLISLFAGGFGVDRFMLGQTGLGVAKLLTLGGCGIWSIIDLFTAQSRAKEYNFNLFSSVMG